MTRKSASSNFRGGSFTDVERLLDQLTGSPVIELGKPLPDSKYLPNRARTCPACHNRVLLDHVNHLPPCEGEDDNGSSAFSNQ